MILLLVLDACCVYAQDKADLFGPPMKIPLVITAGFGEIRPNHFHSGLDFSTAGKSQEVIAAAAGCVSRIKISTKGYGKALYLDHPEGYTTVYAHLSSFEPGIEEYALKMQHQAMDYEIDVLVDSGRFCFKRGETIALSGNTGSSTAPHLHFEIRDKYIENVFNPLFFGYGNDFTPPDASSILLIPRKNRGLVNNSESTLRIPLLKNKSGRRFISSKNPVPLVSGHVGIGFEGGDVIGKKGNLSGVYQIRTFLDNKEIYRSRLDEFSFDESRAVNAYIDYSMYRKGKKKYQQCLVPENPLIGIYKSSFNRGFYPFAKDTTHTFKIELKDFAGNTFEQEIPVKSAGNSFSYRYRAPAANHLRIPPGGGTITRGTFTAVFGPRCLYDSSDVKLILHEQPGKLAPLIELGSIYTPLHNGVELRFKLENIPDELKQKICIAKKSGNGFDVLSSSCSGNEVRAVSKQFGDFTLIADTLPPKIIFIQSKKRNPKTRKIEKISPELAGEIKLKITDPVSETVSFQAYVNDVFILPRPAGKETWVFELPDNLPSGSHNFSVFARDEYNNESTFSIPLNIP
jgi:hypothetical protein